MQPFEGHRNSICLQEFGDTVEGVLVGQYISSLPSTQSSTPLHFASRDKHCCTYAHVNWLLLQAGGRGSAGPARKKKKKAEKGIFIGYLLSVITYTASERQYRRCWKGS